MSGSDRPHPPPERRNGVPEATVRVVEAELGRAAQTMAKAAREGGPAAGTERILLLRAAPYWPGPARISVAGASATVVACPTVLAVLESVSGHAGVAAVADDYLVVLTPVDEEDLGNALLSRVVRHQVRRIDRWDLVLEAFGATRSDPRLTRSERRWLAEALLDAQPARGWGRSAGPVLSLETALNRLAARRLGGPLAAGTPPDPAGLLEWTREPALVSRFTGLAREERDGLTGWLEESLGPVAAVVFRLAGRGNSADTIPYGLIAAELYRPDQPGDPTTIAARARAEERYFGTAPPTEEQLRAFAEATVSLVQRWSDTGHAEWCPPVLDRAERILHEIRAGELAGTSLVLDAGLDARLALLGEELDRLGADPLPQDLASLEAAFADLRRHGRYPAHPHEADAAKAAVRLARWLAAREEPAASLAQAVSHQVRVTAWADRALVALRCAAVSRSARAQAAYRLLTERVSARRRELDTGFAARLAAWTRSGGAADTLSLAETVLERFARPVAHKRAPLIVVLDGMSAAIATELAGEISGSGAWVEVGRDPGGREGALATVPSTTRVSRTSLLCGRFTEGGQDTERAGFAAFWRGRAARLFHRRDLATAPSPGLPPDIAAAIAATSTVVGVVLNAVDDVLHGDQPDSGRWGIDDVPGLRALIDHSGRAGRPVILTSDHGHVLEYGESEQRAPGTDARCRPRDGTTPGSGELLVAGSRVAGAGELIVAVDDRVRYTARHAGYHGGASLAEMVIPVLVLVPSSELTPVGWSPLPPLAQPPVWWQDPLPSLPETPAGQPEPAVAAPPAREQPGRRRRPPAPQDGLFEVGQPAAVVSLGTRTVASEVYATQRSFVRHPPDDAVVSRLIDALQAAGGKLPIGAVVELTGLPPFRVTGFLSQLARLLNVDRYAVIGQTDGGRTVELNSALLTEQFLRGTE